MHFEIIVRQIKEGKIVNEKLIKEIEIRKPESIIDIGFRHSEQTEIIGNIQNSYIPLQCKLLLDNCEVCPKCQDKIR